MNGKKPATPRPDRGYLITEDSHRHLRRMAEQVQLAAVLIAPRRIQDDTLQIPVHILPVTELLYDHARHLRRILNTAHHVFLDKKKR